MEERVSRLLERLGLPTRLEDQPVGAALRLLALDKKRQGSSIKAIFLRDVGDPVIVPLPIGELSSLFEAAAAAS